MTPSPPLHFLKIKRQKIIAQISDKMKTQLEMSIAVIKQRGFFFNRFQHLLSTRLEVGHSSEIYHFSKKKKKVPTYLVVNLDQILNVDFQRL